MPSRHVPESLKRKLKTEAGYRCAVPTCRDKGPFDYEHINPWSEVQNHTFENMVLLCVGCHARVTRNEISKEAIRVYKRNLAILNGRYSLYEIRIIEVFFENVSSDSDWRKYAVQVVPSDILHFKGLLDDNLVSMVRSPGRAIIGNRDQTPSYLKLTPEGHRFMVSYFSGEEVL